MVFPQVYERHELKFKSALLVVKGHLTRREGTCNVVVTLVRPLSTVKIDASLHVPESKDWR